MLKFSWFSRTDGEVAASVVEDRHLRLWKVPQLDFTSGRIWNGNYIRADSLVKNLNTFLSHPRNPSRVCLLSGTRMTHENALYLIGYFRSCAAPEPTLHQAWVRIRVSRVETRLCFLGNLVTRVRTRVWKKKSSMWCGLCTLTCTYVPANRRPISEVKCLAFGQRLSLVPRTVWEHVWVNTIFWAGSNEHFLPNKAEICSIISVSVPAFVFSSVS